MSLISEQKRVDGLVEKALETRLKGNEFFKQNDLQNALQSYHLVLLQLRGTFEFLHLFLVRVATSYESEVALLESNNTQYKLRILIAIFFSTTRPKVLTIRSIQFILV